MKKLTIYSAFLLNLFIIIYFWWQGNAGSFNVTANTIISFGRLFGLLAAFFVLMQFVMRGRAIWIEEVFGLNNLSRIHRLNGYLVLCLIIIHPVLLTFGYAIQAKTNVIKQFLDFLTTYDYVLYAFIGALLFIAIVIVSIFRSKFKYEVWYTFHLMTYVAVALVFFHQIFIGSDLFSNSIFRYYWLALYIFIFGNLLIFRFLRQIYLFMKYQFRVEKLVSESGNAVSIYITGKNISQFKIQPGQFMIFRFLDIKRWWETHPFSLSFVPKNNELRLTAKNVGDFTSEMPTIKTGTPVLLDGPLGTFTYKAATKDKFLFIAGGVGITPIRSLLEEIGPMKKDMLLLYSNKTVDEITFKDEIDQLAKQYNFRVIYIITQDQAYQGEKGRLDKEKIKKLVPDLLKREVYLCGPPPMMDALVITLQELGVLHTAIHYERFAL